MGFVAFSLAAAIAPQAVRGADSIAWRSGVDGEWNDTAKWNPSRLPADGDKVTIGAGGTYTVSMPQSDLVLMPNSFRVSAGNGTTITVDGRGGSFTMPPNAEDIYHNEPWGINASTGHFFNLETYNITDSKNDI